MSNYDLTKNRVSDVKKPVSLETKNLNVFYGPKQSIFDVNLKFPKNKIISLIGSSGSGKSTFLRSLNRMNDKVATVDGKIYYKDLDINSSKINVYKLRQRIGMVFQRPNPFPKSIKENIAFALKEHGMTDNLDKRIEDSLKDAALWEEVKDKLDTSALSLSGGQQQRLCIARAIAIKSDVLLMDEPASALDPISTSQLEKTLQKLKKDYTIIIVTHNMQQASRISDYTAFFHLGHVIEYDTTENIFTNPQMKATEDYVSGNFG